MLRGKTNTPPESGLARDAPKEAYFERTDPWWPEPLAIFVTFTAFVAYSTWAAFFDGTRFMYTEHGAHYLSPFFSPCLSAQCGALAFPFGQAIFPWFVWSPAFLILGVPLGFRFTCYYYRKAYYRSFWMDPAGCAVAERKTGYLGESRLPLVLQNIHRYFMWLALLLLVFLWYDAFIAFRFVDETTGQARFGVSFIGLFLVLNSALLTIYTFSCHSLRHIVGGGKDCFSCTVGGKSRLKAWKGVTRLNENHMLWAWLSLFSVALADVFVRLMAHGVLPDLRLF